MVNTLLATRRGTLQPISIWVGWLRAHNTISSKLSRRTEGAWPEWLYTKVRPLVLVKTQQGLLAYTVQIWHAKPLRLPGAKPATPQAVSPASAASMGS